MPLTGALMRLSELTLLSHKAGFQSSLGRSLSLLAPSVPRGPELAVSPWPLDPGPRTPGPESLLARSLQAP